MTLGLRYRARQREDLRQAAADVLSRHRARVVAFENCEPALKWFVYEGIEAVLVGAKAYWQQWAHYRQSIGYLRLDDLLAQARNPLEEQAARRLWAEIKRQTQEKG